MMAKGKVRLAIDGRRVWWCLLVLGWCSLVEASSLSVSPVRVELSDSRSVAALTVHNRGNEDTALQLELAEWNQNEQGDLYQSSRALLATPPIFTLPAGEQQLIRIGLRRPADPGRELSYRLFIQQLPTSAWEGNGLHMALRLSLPVFVAPAGQAVEPELTWHLKSLDNGTLQLQVHNTGNGHARLSEGLLNLGNQRLPQPGFRYVLPGARHQWPLPIGAPQAAASARLSIKVNGRPHTLTIPLS
ncbi:fimbrial biogenesis chaperone [Oceanimonas marisflavi]|uniref:fimbrial biogenesis chaperone n=1 Tax=Oceanimonas marisflavi TaxID=2059724 RepID=UPI000D3073BD|nr:molecular chaperone [Oceanimonas marisflavi]